ncbi:MAG: Mini-ribonuclease 3 [Clostridiales bacterium]|nr:Mini-ribonuclease 3 [Clostridiales bacterium]MDY4894303.1 ribonuclease III domain-containing protein [Christensenellaceae bacterium]
MQKEEALKIHPVALAFVGDAVYSLYVREKLVKEANESPGVYQRAAGAAVSAKGQNALIEKVRDSFTEEEADIFRRARNAKKGTKAKSASVAEYNRSTGIEAVIGYLYLTKNHARVREILEKIDVSVQDGRVERKEFKP